MFRFVLVILFFTQQCFDTWACVALLWHPLYIQFSHICWALYPQPLSILVILVHSHLNQYWHNLVWTLWFKNINSVKKSPTWISYYIGLYSHQPHLFYSINMKQVKLKEGFRLTASELVFTPRAVLRQVASPVQGHTVRPRTFECVIAALELICGQHYWHTIMF